MTSVPVPAGTPVVLPAARAALWLFGAVVIALLLYYFIGSDTHIHELVHDGRHLLGFPCH